MTLTSDQIFTKFFPGTNYMITDIVAVRKSGTFGVSCLGGIYSAAAKGGSAVVASAQSWVNLIAGGIQQAVLAAISSTAVRNEIPVFSLTTGNTGALTADIFINGIVID